MKSVKYLLEVPEDLFASFKSEVAKNRSTMKKELNELIKMYIGGKK